MKKLLLLLALFFSTSILLAQNFNQPSQFNNVCDENNDGIGFFYLGEISYEILGNLNPQEYTITHHETQDDAAIGTNVLPGVYYNVEPFSQTIFVRIVTIATNQVTFLNYQLNVIYSPISLTVTITNCLDDTNSFPCWNLNSAVPQIVGVEMGEYSIEYYTTMQNAQNDLNPIANPSCYISPIMAPNQPPVFYRIVNENLCVAIGTIILATEVCQNPNCSNPTDIVISNIETDNAVASWAISQQALSWEFIVKGSNEAPPLDTDSGEIIDSNPLYLFFLNCNTSYKIYIRSICDNEEISGWSSSSIFTTLSCESQPGVPVNLTQCVNDNGLACFDLTQNDYYILGNSNPAVYSVSYYETQSDANAGVNSLVSPYCASTSQAIFARFENTTTQEYQVTSFTIIVEFSNNQVIPLTNMVQCDDNNDTVVTFDLTTIQAQINSTNTLQYYPSLANAQNQVVPFANPSALNIGVQNQLINVFVREIVPNDCDNIYSFQLQVLANCNVAYTCSQANSLCGALGTPFNNTTNVGSAGTYGCLVSSPNPTWFYLPISQAGNINLLIEQSTFPTVSVPNLDADYAIFGPFSDPITPCNGQLTANNIVSCSYSIDSSEYAYITNAQVGQYYLIMVTNYSNDAGYIKISEVPGSTGAIDCSGLKLNAFLDTNANGTQDIGEQNFPLGQFTYEVNNNSNVHNVVSPTGVYTIYDTNTSNTYDLSYEIDLSYLSSYSVLTSYYFDVNVVIGAGIQTYNFPVIITQPYNDLAVNIIPVNAPRPGFLCMNKLVYSNNGNQTIASGTVTFNHDALVSIVTNSQTGTTPITNGFTYNFTNLLPFETREIMLTMQVPVIPTVTIGGLLTNTASIIPLTDDVVAANNSATDSQIIIGAYDPNDKMEAHGERILHSTFTSNDYLTYTIRFENTGNANAINVRVNDVLHESLDQNTIRMISASHSYIMDRVDNKINWIFDDIQLPPSVAETNIGKGYITFKIKPKLGFAVGDIIPNTASIYFDFNPAIITNTFNTEFVQQLGIGEFENADFIFYPNPVSDIVTITVKNEGSIAAMALYDVMGKMIINQKPANALTTQRLDLSMVSKGIYLLEVTTNTNLKVVKKLIVE